MKVAGELIKKTRQARKMTQMELAEGICKQPTISHIENKNSVESFSVIFAICEKLSLDINDVIQDDKSFQMDQVLNQVDYLCVHHKHEKALRLLHERLPLDKIGDYKKSKVLYFYGITNVMGKENYDLGLYYYFKVIELNDDLKYFALAKNGVGVIYALKGEEDAALDYIESSLELLKDSEYRNDIEMMKIYYNASKFFSHLKDYKRAYDLADEGIRILIDGFSSYSLDYLVYEKAYNAMKLGQENYPELYEDAKTFAKYMNNEKILSVIDQDLKNEGLK